MFKTSYQSALSIFIRFMCLSLLLTEITGCAIFKSDFSCNRVGGANGCVSMDQIYSEVQSGKIRADHSPYDGKQQPKLPTTQQNMSASHLNTSGGDGYRASIPEAGEPVRFGENIQKIWIFPFEDNHGNYHETSIVYAVLTPPRWIDQPAESIQALGASA